ncbi:MAG: redox-sensing transcriptional repressor Rex [Planctomycetota bacterium]|nr:MAG: redox-sensing transcriptional repressor Rex [Planctomycetota bacterium]
MKKLLKTPFTLIEVLIVVIILGTLAAIVIPQFAGVAEDSHEKVMKSNLATVRTAIQAYKVKTNAYPILSADLTSTTTVNSVTIKAYLKEMPTNTSNNKNDVNQTSSSMGTVTDTKGWNYNKTTGEFWPDTTGHGSY